MLLFHGTRVSRDALDSIFREGLRARCVDWMHDEAPQLCFVANTPVGGRGGDPVWFAMGRSTSARWRHRTEGYIVVLDVPRAALEEALVAVFPNHALEQYFETEWLRRRPLARLGTRRTLLGCLIRLGRASDAELDLFRQCGASLDGAYDFDRGDYATWCKYADALVAARSMADVERAGRRYGVRWEQPEVPHCELCVQGMATWSYELPSSIGGERRTKLPASLLGRRIDPSGWIAMARPLSRWFGERSCDEIDALLCALSPDATWEGVLQHIPVDSAVLPEVWRPGFGLRWDESGWRSEDVQLACRALGPEHVRGAIQITAGDQMAAWARCGRGRPLASKLWRAAHAIVDQYRGQPVRFAGEGG